MDVTAQQKNIELAQRSKNVMEGVVKYESYTNDKLSCTVSCKLKSELDPKTIKWAFKLAEKNVSGYYKSCNLGWQPKIKQKDLNKTWARYLIASDTTTKQPIAYAMFRFDLDYGSSVLYCYELQIADEYQRKGLGAFLMEALETIAQRWKMEKLVLTVLKNNPNGLEFFSKLG